MEIEREVKKMTLGHEFGAGASCLKCKDKCEGFELHFWRKICRNCKCGLAEHDVQMNLEQNKKVGKLFEDTKYTGLIAKLKTDGIPGYQGNAVTIMLPSPATAYTQPPRASSTVVPPPAAAGSAHPGGGALGGVLGGGASTGGGVSTEGGAPGRGVPTGGGVSTGGAPALQAATSAASVRANRVPFPVNAMLTSVESVPKEVPMTSVTFEWVPPITNKYLAVRYIQLLPPEKRPLAGSEGAAYRRQQMARQLPEHDQDPSKCHELSPAEVKLMQQYVRKYKDDALGIGDVRLPEEMALVRGGPGGAGAGTGPGSGGDSVVAAPPWSGGAVGTAAAAGAIGVPEGQRAGPAQNFSCHHCQQPMSRGDPAVYAERAGYDKLWHPACFVCSTCGELLVDMIYFFKKGRMYCGRHYGDSEKPRCAGCDELIFSKEYTQAEGHNWHLKHFCCFNCDCVLAGETYVMEDDKPVCKPCYMNNYAVKCVTCQAAVEPEAQRVSYGEHHWHAAPPCFKCSGCSKCLIGQRFMAVQGSLFCSMECKKKN